MKVVMIFCIFLSSSLVVLSKSTCRDNNHHYSAATKHKLNQIKNLNQCLIDNEVNTRKEILAIADQTLDKLRCEAIGTTEWLLKKADCHRASKLNTAKCRCVEARNTEIYSGYIQLSQEISRKREESITEFTNKNSEIFSDARNLTDAYRIIDLGDRFFGDQTKNFEDTNQRAFTRLENYIKTWKSDSAELILKNKKSFNNKLDNFSAFIKSRLALLDECIERAVTPVTSSSLIESSADDCPVHGGDNGAARQKTQSQCSCGKNIEKPMLCLSLKY